MRSEVNSTEMKEIKVSIQEEKLIQAIRSLDFGEIRIIVTDHRPIRIEEIKKSIKL